MCAIRLPTCSIASRRFRKASRTLVIGEDLGVVPPGFREILAARAMHRYIVYFFERWDGGFSDPAWWPRDALACIGTHDMPSFAAWWAGEDIALSHSLGLYGAVDIDTLRRRSASATGSCSARISVRWRGLPMSRSFPCDCIARSPPVPAGSRCCRSRMRSASRRGSTCRARSPNIPTGDSKLPVGLDRLADEPSFRRHAEVMRSARPR